jgi:hypothetical protein
MQALIKGLEKTPKKHQKIKKGGAAFLLRP